MTRPLARLLGAGLALALVGGACSGDDDGGPTTTDGATATSAPPTGTELDGVHLTTTQVATLEAPTALATRPGTRDLYVAEKAGTVRRLVASTPRAADPDAPPTYTVARTPVLDLTGTLATDGEQGLLGLVLSSDGRTLYAFSTLAPDGTSELSAYDLGEGTTADPDSKRVLLTLERKYANHNGGQLALGPDGYLYVGIGDGGSGGDPDHHGQDPATPFGKVLRIDPEAGTGDRPGTEARVGDAYGIPAGNPATAGGARPEVWLGGVRNPWRFSFDRATGDLWIGDVGQERWEEVDHLAAADGRDAGRGANLGWNRMEGTHPYDGGTNPAGGVLPVFEYSHDDGACSITGGYVYRGTALPDLVGAYLFTDFCRPGLQAIRVSGGRTTSHRTFDLPLEQVQSFGEDGAGELYALQADGAVLRLDPPGARATGPARSSTTSTTAR